MKYITSCKILRKALDAYARARRDNPALPTPIRGEGKAVTLGGKLAAIIPLSDGTTTGYAAEPTYRLVQLSRAQLPPYQHDVKAATPHARVKRLLEMLLSALAVVENDADRIRAELAQRLNAAHANGNGTDGGNRHVPVNDLADAIGIHLAAEKRTGK
jgi:hypothetical protein